MILAVKIEKLFSKKFYFKLQIKHHFFRAKIQMKKRAGRYSSKNDFDGWVIKFSMPENDNMTLFLIT